MTLNIYIFYILLFSKIYYKINKKHWKGNCNKQKPENSWENAAYSGLKSMICKEALIRYSLII